MLLNKMQKTKYFSTIQTMVKIKENVIIKLLIIYKKLNSCYETIKVLLKCRL